MLGVMPCGPEVLHTLSPGVLRASLLSRGCVRTVIGMPLYRTVYDVVTRLSLPLIA